MDLALVKITRSRSRAWSAAADFSHAPGPSSRFGQMLNMLEMSRMQMNAVFQNSTRGKS